MTETPQQYTKRILSYVAGRKPLAVQAATPKKLARMIAPLTRAQLCRRPGPGKWSIREILSHLAEAELVGGYRLRMILSTNRTPIQAYDQNVWAKNSNYAAWDPHEAIELFSTLRAANLKLMKSLSRAQWKKYGIHAERGKETVLRVAQMYAGHDINHLEQMRRIAAEARRKK